MVRDADVAALADDRGGLVVPGAVGRGVVAGAAIVEWAGWIRLIICGTYGTMRKPLRVLIRRTHGLPALRVPNSERYRWHQLLLLSLAISSPIGWWPLRVNLFLQGPVLERFAWHVYAEMPMSHPPRTPQMVGLFIVKGVRASPNGVGMTVMGAGGRLDYSPSGARQTQWLQRQSVPWFLRWVIPPRIGKWSVDSTHYKPYGG